MFDESEMPKTLVEAVRYFSSLDVCRKAFVKLRWPDGVECPRGGCGSKDVHFIASRGIWRCNACKKQFSVKVGTIFEDSPIGLDKWLPAVWIMTASKKGISSCQAARTLGVTQKTAWFMNHRIRAAMKTQSFLKPLSGEVEVDETYVGGKEKYKHANRKICKGTGMTGYIGKVAVMGLLERHGKIRTAVVLSNRKKVVQKKVRENVEPGSAVFTDALRSYNGLDAEYIHEVIDHAEAYVRDNVHTNGLENFWSLTKRCIYGIYHSVDAYHLEKYLDEIGYRFNERGKDDLARFSEIVGRTAGIRMTYGELTGKTES